MYEINLEEKYQTKLKNCDINSCKGMCCYDGVYLMDGEEEYLSAIVNKFKDFFSFLPKNYIVDGNWKNVVKGRKTNVKKCSNFPNDFPTHFNKTICVFAIDGGKCSLQILADKLNVHKWTFKPTTCWLFPLNLVDGKITPPPKEPKYDPDYYDDSYPGFSTYVRCGKHQEDGEVFYKVLEEEINYLNKYKKFAYWARSGLTIDEIIEKNKL